MKKGILHVVFAHIIFLSLPFSTAPTNCKSNFILAFAFLLLWLIQFIYIIPMLIIIFMANKEETERGILIASGITFLLGGGICSGMWLQNMFK